MESTRLVVNHKEQNFKQFSFFDKQESIIPYKQCEFYKAVSFVGKNEESVTNKHNKYNLTLLKSVTIERNSVISHLFKSVIL